MQTNVSTAPMPQSGPHDTPTDATSEMDDFIYLISHDVRASVRALLELPQWIKEDLEDAGVSTGGAVGTSIDLMNRHTGRLDRMLVDLLAYSRVGRMQQVAPLNVAEVLEDVLDHMTIPAGFTVTHDLKCDTLVMGDRDLQQLLSALISNAIKHHHKDTGRVHIVASTHGSQAQISVADDGPGIEEKFCERVFSPMTTLRPRDEVEGSGMGLAKVRKIAQHYAGQTAVIPSPFGTGLCVEVTMSLQAEH